MDCRAALYRGTGQNFDLRQTPATVAHRRPYAVGAGVATADDDHMLIEPEM
jgi:hypothetical protein